MTAATWAPCCFAAGAIPGTGLPCQASMVAVSPITKISGRPGDGQIRLDLDAPGAVRRRAEPGGGRRGAHPGAPTE